jgi:hypothetical protein
MQNVQYIYYNPLHVSSNIFLSLRRLNCINTASGMSLSVSDLSVHRLRKNSLVLSQSVQWTVTYWQWHTRCCINTIWSTVDEQDIAQNMSRIVIIVLKICASSWPLAKVILRCTVSETSKQENLVSHLSSLSSTDHHIPSSRNHTNENWAWIVMVCVLFNDTVRVWNYTPISSDTDSVVKWHTNIHHRPIHAQFCLSGFVKTEIQIFAIWMHSKMFCDCGACSQFVI